MAKPSFGKLEWPSGCGLQGSADNVPYTLRFRAGPYSIFSEKRDNAPRSDFADITLPFTKGMRRENSITYNPGETETGHMFDFTAGGMWESLKTGFGLFSAVKDAFGVGSVMGQRPMDMRDSIYQGANFRVHSFEWKLVPKCDSDIDEITEICNAFQTCAYPMMSGFESASRVIHPPVWNIDAMGPGGKEEMARRWTFKCLPSVLTGVRIDPTVEGTYHFAEGYPAVTNLSLTFQELEPAVAAGNELKSRSQVK